MEGQIHKLVAEKRLAEDQVRELTNLLRDLKGELEEWKRRYIELEDSRANEEELEELRKQFESLQNINIVIFFAYTIETNKLNSKSETSNKNSLLKEPLMRLKSSN